MRSPELSRFALIACVAIVMLAGCGGSQPLIGAPGAMPQTSAIATHAERGTSWMLPEAKQLTLLYVATDEYGVYVYDYPSGKLVGILNDSTSSEDLCTDVKGDVYVTDTVGKQVVEYAHGGDSPIRRLTDGDGFAPYSCAVDPSTGNLAATELDSPSILIFKEAKGHPKLLFDPGAQMWFCTYDSKGNLFTNRLDRHHHAFIGELPRGSSTFKNLELSKYLKPLTGMQWHGKYLAVGNLFGGKVYQVSISASKATVVGTTHLAASKDIQQFWIDKDRIINASQKTDVISIWPYPAGGAPVKTIRYVSSPLGVVVSHGI
jgi:hypothetical protein